MFEAVETDEAFDPLQVHALGADGIMLHPQLLANLVEQAGLVGHDGVVYKTGHGVVRSGDYMISLTMDSDKG